MNIDLLPFSSFALESCAPAAGKRLEAQTLTLALAITPRGVSQEPMSGKASTNQKARASQNVLRAAVVPADGSALTLTF